MRRPWDPGFWRLVMSLDPVHYKVSVREVSATHDSVCNSLKLYDYNKELEMLYISI
jgi:hypothetical protein